MSCTFKNLTEDQVKARAEHNFFFGKIKETSSQGEIISTLVKLREFTTEVVEAARIDPKWRKKLRVKEGETQQRYVSRVREVLLSKRITDKNYIAFLQNNKDAELINQYVDSQLKATWGTKIHNAAQNILEQLIETSKSTLIIKNNEEGYSYNKISPSSLLTGPMLSNLEVGIKSIFNQILQKQQEIDPKGKVKIMTEQFFPDFLNDLGATADVFILFSDGSVGILDFKTKSPEIEGNWAKVERTKEGFNIIDNKWLPEYAKDDFKRQIRGIRDILFRTLKRNNIVFSRVIPIHVQYQQKSKLLQETGSKIEDKLIYLGMEREDPFLAQIPIDERMTNAKLDEMLAVYERTMHNYEIFIKEAKGDIKKQSYYRALLEKKKEARDALILEYDMNFIYQDFKDLMDSFYKGGALKDIDNPTTKKGGKDVQNPDYLDNIELGEKISELQSYQNILDSTEGFAAELNMQGQPLKMDEIKRLSGYISSLINQLRHKRIERSVTPQQLENIKTAQKVSFIDSMFLRSKEFNQQVFRIFHDKTSIATANTKLSMQKIELEIKEHMIEVQKWAKNNNSTLWGGYEMVLGERNITGRFNKEFGEFIDNLIEKRDIEGLKKIYILKEDAQERKDEMRRRVMIAHPRGSKHLRDWDARFDFNRVILNPKLNRMFYDLTEEVQKDPKFLNPKYVELQKPGNEALLNFWNYWTEKMTEARKLYGLHSYEELPSNFLPEIRAMVNEKIARFDISMVDLTEYVRASVTLTEDNVEFGNLTMKNKIDVLTGVEKLQVPRHYITPLKNKKGEIDPSLKSRDLGQSLYTFLYHAHEYHNLTTIVEPHIEALRDLLVMYGHEHRDSKGGIIKEATGRIAKKFGANNELSGEFEKHFNYHLYKKGAQGADPKTAAKLKAAKKYHSYYQLGLGWVTWFGNLAQVSYGAWQEGQSSYFYTPAHIKTSLIHAFKNNSLFDPLMFIFEPNPDAESIKRLKLNSSVIQRRISADTLYWGFRKAEHGVSNLIAYSMLQNYGIYEGKLIRLNSPSAPANVKSILESTKEVNGRAIIEGLTDSEGNITNVELYADMRNRIIGVAGNVKGGNNSENQYGAQMTLAGELAMQYKTWMPGMITQRLSGLRYNHMTKSMHMGTYRTFMKDSWDTEKSMLTNLFSVLAPNLLKLTLYTATTPVRLLFGKYGTEGFRFKTNEHRAQRMFEEYKAKYKSDPEIQSITFEEFLEYQKGRIKALATEAFTIISLMLMIVAAKSDWDEDGIPDWKASWYSRTMFRMLNRARREIAFLVAIEDWRYTISRTAIPATGVIEDTYKLATSFLSTTSALVFDGENATKEWQKTQRYGIKMIPGVNRATRIFEGLDTDFAKAFKDLEY